MVDTMMEEMSTQENSLRCSGHDFIKTNIKKIIRALVPWIKGQESTLGSWES